MLRKTMALTLCVLLVAAAGSLAYGGQVSGGKIVHIASIDGAILFNVVGGTVSQARPACATSGRFAVPAGSSHAAVVLTAFATRNTVGSVRGKGTCTTWADAEDIVWVAICPWSGC